LAKELTIPTAAHPEANELPQGSQTNDPLAALIVTSLEDDKAEDIVVIDLAGKTSIADAMVVASGRSPRQVGAMADHLVEMLKSQGHKVTMEGKTNCDWVLVDAGDVVVHLFRPEVRVFYNLEKMWGAVAAQRLEAEGPVSEI
jgi:ribosome-associated protein